MRTSVFLGDVDLPDGVLMLLDPGLGRYWRHDLEPVSPRRDETPEYDLRIVGPDAERAGRAYDREFNPLYLFDQPDPDVAKQHFDEFARARGMDAIAEQLTVRVPHATRAELALAAGAGLGAVTYNRFWAVAVGELPRGIGLPVYGIPMGEGEFAGRWRAIELVVNAAAAVSSVDDVSGVMAEHGQVMFASLSALGSFRAGESRDGLGDFVFWGRDAKVLAQAVSARALDGDEYGWRDVPMVELRALAQRVAERCEADDLKVGRDYRPHCHLEALNAQIRSGAERVGTITLGGSRVVACDNRWGDGVFSVSRMRDASGRVVRVRLELGTEERQELMRQVWVRHQLAIATRAITDDGEPIRFAERVAPNNPSDSGWCFAAGVEDDEYMSDASNLVIVSLATLVAQTPALGAILTAKEGSLFRLEGDAYVPDE
ncbi:MAG: DUF2185 domain-containing protein [Polyangiales bacterium]